MKLSNFRFAFVLLSVMLLSLLSFGQAKAEVLHLSSFASAEQASGNPEKLTAGFYLVIGVFEYEKNAKKMVNNANKEGLDAEYKMYPTTGYYYVFTSSSDDRLRVLEDYSVVRQNTVFTDAWLLKVKNESDPEIILTTEEESLSLGLTDDSGTAEETVSPESMNYQAEISEEKEEEIIPIVVVRPINATNGDLIEASIELVDGMRAKLIAKIDSADPWLVENTEEYDTVQVISEALGFRKMQLDFIPNNPINDTTALYTHLENDTIYIQMDLVELQEGDFQIMYNTYFYGNSTVMREQSRYELEKLYDIMADKPNMRIRLHGHTNGNSRGVAYLFQEEHKNFFDIRRTKEFTKNGVSSKKLSSYRAETIKSYLVNKGIESERIETKGWGGKKLLYETDSPLAKNNIRVEIEVLKK